MRVLVIGGTHFIGPYVIRYLVFAGHTVKVFHRGQTKADLPTTVTYLQGNRQDIHQYQSQIEAFAPDVILDMIPYTAADAQTVLNTITGTCSRIVAISSQDVYRARDVIWGLETDIVDSTPLTESSPLRSQLYPYQNAPQRPLGVPSNYDKILVERTYLNAADMAVTLLRLPMVYGPGDPLHRFYAYLHRMDSKRPVIVLDARLAQWQSSYGYVENIAWGIALAVMQNPESESTTSHRIYNLSELHPLSEKERLNLLAQSANWPGQILAAMPDQLPPDRLIPFNFQQDWTTDSSLIRQELGYQEPVSITTALERTLHWERQNPPTDIQNSASAMVLLDPEIEDRVVAAFSH